MIIEPKNCGNCRFFKHSAIAHLGDCTFVFPPALRDTVESTIVRTDDVCSLFQWYEGRDD